jgi:hypothetical protein
MKREVTYHCGHSETRSFSGSHSARDAYNEKLSREDCPACRSAQAATRSADAGLPTLTGSDKQIAWAEQIRQQAVTAFAEAQDVIEAAAPDEASKQRARDTLAMIRTRTMGTTDSRIWIEIRDRVNRPHIINAVKQTMIEQMR